MSDVKPEPSAPEKALNVPRIDEVLYSLSRQYGRTMLLLDRFKGAPLQEEIDALTPPANGLPLDDPIFGDDMQRTPLLLELQHGEPSHQVILEKSIAHAQEQTRQVGGAFHVCAWLFGNISLERMRYALRQRLNAGYPRGERIYLRYFDPRVMPRLAQLLDRSEKCSHRQQPDFGQLLGPVRTWCQLDREGKFLRLDNPRPSDTLLGGHLNFDVEAASAIDRIQLINLTVCALRKRATPCKQDDDAVIEAHLLAAQKAGLREHGDQIAYAWRAVKYGRTFTLHPQLGEWVMHAAEQGAPLEALLEAHLPEASLGIARAEPY